MPAAALALKLAAAALTLTLITASGPGRCATSAPAGDPLNSPAWEAMQQRFLKGQRIVFDARVMVHAPTNAEDPLQVPVRVDAPGLPDVQEIMVIADLNPIQKILDYKPTRARAVVSFRFKVEQSTPIRAAMRTRDGVWHLGGTWLTAAGGGCTTPSAGSRGLWQGRVGEMSGALWPTGPDAQRVRVRVVHPMDTGLASGIPAFYMNHLVLSTTSGEELAILDAFEPIGENPVLSFDVYAHGAVHVAARDIQGNRFDGLINP